MLVPVRAASAPYISSAIARRQGAVEYLGGEAVQNFHVDQLEEIHIHQFAEVAILKVVPDAENICTCFREFSRRHFYSGHCRASV